MLLECAEIIFVVIELGEQAVLGDQVHLGIVAGLADLSLESLGSEIRLQLAEFFAALDGGADAVFLGVGHFNTGQRLVNSDDAIADG